MRLSRATTVTVTLLALFALGPPAWAPPTTPSPDLYFLTGTVRDPLARGVGGVVVQVTHLNCNPVTDPDQCVVKQDLTASDGTWRVGEKTPGEYGIYASRTGVTSASGSQTMVAPGDYTVDLAVSYLVSGVLSPSIYLSTASSSASATLTITSWAPHSGTGGAGDSCVWVTDSRTGSITQAAYSGPGAGSSHLFTWGLSLAQNTTEGTYSLSYYAQDCGGSTHLSTTSSTPYVVDNSALLIFFLTPLDYGNVAFAQAPLAAKVADSGPAGVDGANTRFTLTDESDPARPTWTWQGAGTISWDQASSWAKTPAVAFTQAHVYRLEVRGVDRAGNATTVTQAPASGGGGFLAMSGSGSGHVSISAPCTVGPVKLNGRRDVTCPDVAADFADGTVTFSGTRHGGVGRVRQTFSFAGARLANPALTNVEVDAFGLGNTPPPAPVYPASFRVPSAGCPSQAPCAAPGASAAAGTVTTEVLAAWAGDAAVLTLEADTGSAQVPPTLWMDSCADPTTAPSLTCVPDPVAAVLPEGTPVDDRDPRGMWGATEAESMVSAPLLAEAPDWYTPELARQVHQAAGAPVTPTLPAGSRLPPTVGIRPGARVMVPACTGSPPACPDLPEDYVVPGCTVDFVFERADGVWGIGFAGHCIPPGHDWRTIPEYVHVFMLEPGTGLPRVVEVGQVIARFYCPTPSSTGTDCDRSIHWWGSDVALVQIYDSVEPLVFPDIASIGGPCGEFTDPVAFLDHLRYVAFDGAPQDGFARDAQAFWVSFVGPAAKGDSGSPIRREQDEKAVGLLTRFGILDYDNGTSNDDPSRVVVGARMASFHRLFEVQLAGQSWTLLPDPTCPGS